MKIVFYIFFLLLMIGCNDKNSQTKSVDEVIPNPQEVLRDYVKNPKTNDKFAKMILKERKKT